LEVMSTSGGILRLKRNDVIVTGGESLGALQFYSNDDNADAEGVRAKISALNKESDSNGTKTNLAFYTANGIASNLAEAMRIDESGNVGIGTTAPDKILEINGASGGTLRLTYNDSNGSAATYTDLSIDSSGILNINPTGNAITLGGGATATELRWREPSGSGTNYMAFKVPALGGNLTYTWPSGYGTSGYQLSTDGSGTLSWTSQGSSLRALKENIRPYGDPMDALDKILNAQVYTFNYKPGMGTGDSETTYTGIMADDNPWVTQYNGTQISLVSTLGYMILGDQALNQKITVLDLSLSDAGLINATSTYASTTTEFAESHSRFVDIVKSVLEKLGLAIKDGVASLKEVVVSKFTAKTARIEQLEMVDKVTGKVYCTWIENGVWEKTEGLCDEALADDTNDTNDFPSSFESDADGSSSNGTGITLNTATDTAATDTAAIADIATATDMTADSGTDSAAAESTIGDSTTVGDLTTAAAAAIIDSADLMNGSDSATDTDTANDTSTISSDTSLSAAEGPIGGE